MLYDLGFVKEVEKISRPTSVEEYRYFNNLESTEKTRSIHMLIIRLHSQDHIYMANSMKCIYTNYTRT